MRGIRELNFSKQGDLLNFDWHYDSMMEWARSASLLTATATQMPDEQKADIQRTAT